jgi:hypothetical protein
MLAWAILVLAWLEWFLGATNHHSQTYTKTHITFGPNTWAKMMANWNVLVRFPEAGDKMASGGCVKQELWDFTKICFTIEKPSFFNNKIYDFHVFSKPLQRSINYLYSSCPKPLALLFTRRRAGINYFYSCRLLLMLAWAMLVLA